MNRDRFTHEEAVELIGATIRTRVAWAGVLPGTTGQINGCQEMGDGWDVIIKWDLPQDPPSLAFGISAGELIAFLNAGTPLLDWFTKEEYETYLEAV